jgi:hypothetical protein
MRLGLTIAAVGIVAATAGCTSAPAHHASPVQSQAPKAVPTAPSTVETVGSLPAGEHLLGNLSNQRGINEIGPFPRTSDGIAVYVDCIGKGSVHVQVVDVAAFDITCSNGEDPGLKNSLDVRYVNTVDVRITGDNSLRWSAVVVSD